MVVAIAAVNALQGCLACMGTALAGHSNTHLVRRQRAASDYYRVAGRLLILLKLWRRIKWPGHRGIQVEHCDAVSDSSGSGNSTSDCAMLLLERKQNS